MTADNAAPLALAVLDQLDGGIAVLDRDLRVVVWNEWLARASGRSAASMHGQLLFDVLNAGTRLRDAAHDALATGVSTLLSHNLNRAILPLAGRDGATLLHAASVKPLTVDGAPCCLIQISDVTRTMERERLLRERRDARFRALVDAASDAILTTDPQGRIQWVNDETIHRFGHLIAERGGDVLEGTPIDTLLGEAAAAWTDPRAATVEIEASGPSGAKMPMELSLARWQSDGRTLVTGFLRDIGERRRAQAEIAARHLEMEQLAAQTRMTLDALPASIIVLDDAGTIVFANRGFAALAEAGWLGGGCHVGANYLSALESAGANHPDRGRALANLRALLSGEITGFSIEAARVVTCGVRYFRCIGATIAGGPLGKAVYMLLDITEQKQLEDALRDLNATLEARVAAEIAARQRAQEMARHADQMRTLGQLAGGMAHDFNNVLQAISGGARLLLGRLDRPEVARPLVQLISDAAERGASITGRLLSFAHRGELRADPVDTVALLGDLRVVLTHTLGSGIVVTVEAEPDLPPALADKAQLETVLVNLATNARDAMPGGGRLLIAVGTETIDASSDSGLAPGRYLRLTVSDNGVGMDEATLARVSEPFFTTKPVGRGTGLGLAMARGFVDQSGGALRIASRLGEGTDIVLWLPAADAASASPSAQAPAPAEPGPHSIGAAHVLLVDDEPLIREVLRASLEDRGFAVVAVSSGKAALQFLDMEPGIGVLVTDLAMPEMDGMTLIRHARLRRPDLPILLLTGFAEASPAAIADSASGQFDMLRKPASSEQIAASITRLLRRQPAPLPTAAGTPGRALHVGSFN